MIKGFVASSVILTFLLILCACNNKSTVKDQRCPTLVEKAEYYNAQLGNGSKEGFMGITARVEYVDSVYRIIQEVDENLIPEEKLKMFYGNQKPNMIAMLFASSGQERRECQQMVAYRVTYKNYVCQKITNKHTYEKLKDILYLLATYILMYGT